MTIMASASRATRTFTEGVAVVMPAYREADNLEATVEDFLTTLAGAGCDHRVVVVDDGSPDGTGEVLDRLVRRHPGRVIAVHHEVNRGYGAAVRSGVRAALERTDLRRVLLTDSDGQFKAEDLLVFLAAQREDRADGVIGYRVKRADPLIRRVNGHLWTLASRLLLGTRSRDVDCAYKLLDRWLLEDLDLVGEAAAIDPELLAKAGQNHTRIIEHPVNHYPREHGSPTGASVRVILRSLLSLARIYRDLVRDGHKWSRTRRLWNPRDPVLALVTMAAAALSIGAFVHFYRQGTVLAYSDAVSHMMISRRVVDSPTAGAAQLGGVWPPLPHVLSLPFIWHDGLYYSGVAGTLGSMAGYVVTVNYLYRIAAHMAAGASAGASSAEHTGRIAGVAAAGLFALNPSVLYLQSTPMTELLLFACIAAAIYHLQQWCHTGRYGQLAMASVATMLGSLARYEGWVLVLAVTAVVGYTAFRRWKGDTRLEAHLIFFGVIAFSGIVAWVGWNVVIFGDPFYWQASEFAESSLWVSQADKTIGATGVSWRTYTGAMVHDLGIHGDFSNVRFGLVLAMPTAVFGGYLISLVPRRVPKRTLVQAAVAAGVIATVLGITGTATRAEPLDHLDSPSGQATQGAATWLRRNYDGGRLLMQNFGNEVAVFNSRVPTGEILYEGSFRIWERALADPVRERVRWIYVRSLKGSEDLVWNALYGKPALTGQYALVFADKHQQIYRWKGTR